MPEVKIIDIRPAQGSKISLQNIDPQITKQLSEILNISVPHGTSLVYNDNIEHLILLRNTCLCLSGQEIMQFRLMLKNIKDQFNTLDTSKFSKKLKEEINEIISKEIKNFKETIKVD